MALNSFLGSGIKEPVRRLGGGFLLIIRAIVEVVLVVGFLGALIATAVVGTAPAWQLFGAYATVRGVALVLEVLARK